MPELISWFATAVAIIGTIANSYKKRFGFYFWLASNVFWVWFNIHNAMYAQAAVYIFNSVMCLIGLKQWKRRDDNDNR